jgi:hypothetical protein
MLNRSNAFAQKNFSKIKHRSADSHQASIIDPESDSGAKRTLG